MPQKAMPWTAAMEEFLAARDGEWVSKDEVLAVGAALVPDEIALKEMKNRAGSLSDEKRLHSGRRSKAQQGLMGSKRFGKVAESGDKKSVMWLGNESHSIGELARRLAPVEELVDRVEALETQVQFLIDKLTGETTQTAEEFFAAAGIAREG